MRSATTLAGVPYRHGRIVFHEKVKIAAQDIKFVNLLVDAWTANDIKFMHVLTANPPLFSEGISLEPYDISGWDAGTYSQFLNEMVEEVSEKGLEMYSIICDNLPVQVKRSEVFRKADQMNHE
jgi:hypothetical protein